MRPPLHAAGEVERKLVKLLVLLDHACPWKSGLSRIARSSRFLRSIWNQLIK
jgi:hypothetical protein